MVDSFKVVKMLMEDMLKPARHHWYTKPVGGSGGSFGWGKIECFLLAPQFLAGVEAAQSQLHRPTAAKSDLVQGNIFFPETLPSV